METTVGTVETDLFGKTAVVFLKITTFRIILYKYNKRGDDEVRSYWFNLDCSDKPFHDEEGFLIAGVETSLPEYSVDESKGGLFTWETSYINPDGIRKTAEVVKVFPLKYHYHQEKRYVKVLEIISVPGLIIDGKESYPALLPFVGKFYTVRRGPMGKLKMIDLEIMHQSPETASSYPAGEVPEECPMHENKATRARDSIKVKSKIKKGTSEKTKPTRKKERQPAVDEVKADSTNQPPEMQSEPTAQAQTADKKKTKKPAFGWKKVATTALDVGSKLKGGLDMIGKVTSAAATSGAVTIREIAEKGTESVKRAGESIKDAAQETFTDAAVSTGVGGPVCLACGAPNRSGALFCRKCGQKIAERAVEEVKDHLKGKVENAVVDRVKKDLEEEEVQTSEQDLREEKIDSADLSANIIKPLKKAGIKTMGDLADRAAEAHDKLLEIKGIGSASIEKIKEAVANIPPAVKATVEPSGQVCRNCGKPIHPEWSFCPYCKTAIQSVCPNCGVKINEEWKFCPICQASLNK